MSHTAPDAAEYAALNRLLRDFSRANRDHYSRLIDDYIATCANARNRIQFAPAPSLLALRGIQSVHTQFLDQQEIIENSLVMDLSPLADTYINGLDLQIRRLRPQNDAAAIKLLQDEIDTIRQDPHYFRNLMLSQPD